MVTKLKALNHKTCLVAFMFMALVLGSCQKKNDKPAASEELVPESPEIFGYFIRYSDSYQDERGNPTSAGGGATVKAYFKNDVNWASSTKVSQVKVNTYELAYVDNPNLTEDWFSGYGLKLQGDSISYPKQYYYLPTSAFTSTFVYPGSSPIWSITGLNDIPDFTYTDTLSDFGILMLYSPPKGIISKSAGFKFVYLTRQQMTVQFEVSDQGAPGANKYSTSMVLHPKIKKEDVYIGDSLAHWSVAYSDTINITPAMLEKLSIGKSGAFISVFGEKNITPSIKGKKFRFSQQFTRRFYIDINK